jgi:hypothetical protein
MLGSDRQRGMPEVVPSDALTRVLCLREFSSVAVLVTVPELANAGGLRGELRVQTVQSEDLGNLIEAAWTHTAANGGLERGDALRTLERMKRRLDPSHVIGRWMHAQFDPLLARVMGQPYESPHAVPEVVSTSAVTAAVATGLRRVVVLPLADHFWQWIPEPGLLLIAERSRNDPCAYRTALAAVVSP